MSSSRPTRWQVSASPGVEAPKPAPVRAFRFNHASRINGRPYEHDRMDFAVSAGTVELWELQNRSDNVHVFHVHDVSFTVVTIDGRPPPPELAGLKDSVLLRRGTTARIAVRLPNHADPASHVPLPPTRAVVVTGRRR